MVGRRRLLATTSTAPASLPALPASAADGPGLRVESTTVEYATHPLGLDTARPRLTWTLGSNARDQLQSAYRIRVATSPDRLGSPDV